MTSYADLVHADGALVHLPLTEATGPTSHDVIGAHDGTWYNDPTPGVSGPITGETALTFAHGPDGPFVLLAEPGTLPTFPGPFSWEVWFMLPSYLTLFCGPTFSTGTRIDGVVVRDALLNACSPDTPFLNLHVDAPPFSSFSDGSGPDETLAYDGGWHHLVYTCDGAGATAIFLDAVAIANDGAPTGWSVEEPTAAVIGGQAQMYDPMSYPYVGAFAGSLAHVALYPAALLPCQVLAHYDLATTGTYTPCPEWLRLAHKSGQGYWQSKGDVTEEWSGGVRRLALPFAVLGTTPPQLVGQDPASGLPAFCPTPAVVQTVQAQIIAPLPSQQPPGGGLINCTQRRCGAAVAMTGLLVQRYQQFAGPLNLATGFGVVEVGAALLEEVGKTLFLLSTSLSNLFNGMKAPLLSGLTGLSSWFFDPLGSGDILQLQQCCFCQLACDTTNGVSVTSAQISAWNHCQGTATTFALDLPKVALLSAILIASALADWEVKAAQGGDSGACDTWVCP